MEGKISGVKARGRPRRAWTDDLKDLTELRNYSELKRTAEDRTIWNSLSRQRSTTSEEDTRRRRRTLTNVNANLTFTFAIYLCTFTFAINLCKILLK